MNPTSPAATVLDEVATWAGITTQPTPRGATAIVFEGHELVMSTRTAARSTFPFPPTDARKCSKQDGPRNGSPAGSPSNSPAAQMRKTGCGAGIVLRCPHCDNVLAKIVKSDSRVWIDSTGIRTLEVSV